MWDCILGAALALVVVFASNFTDAKHVERQGYITYDQQEQDKEQCERNIKRSEHCVPDIIWLPVATEQI